MTFSEEIEDEIKEFVSRTENIYYFPDSNYGVEYLNNNFNFLGTKIDLAKEKNYTSYDFKKNNFLDMIKFFELKKIKEKILLSKEIHYIGDGITNSELIFSGKEFFKILEFLFENQLNIEKIVKPFMMMRVLNPLAIFKNLKLENSNIKIFF